MTAEILIVDDNSDIRNILNELISDAGYKTRVAANYNQALSEIDKKIPDVAILDVKLDKGDNDGIQLLSHIKSINKDVPVIISDESAARKATAVATSLSFATLPNGIFFSILFLNFLFLKNFFTIGVSTNVGQTVFTLIL